jgi:PPOX class probable F420-dependent enzyme
MAPGPVDELPRWAAHLLRTARVGRLGLLDGDGRPRVLPVTFAVVSGALVSAVDAKPKRVAGADLARVRWLRRSPSAAFTVDRYDEDWQALQWVQVLGAVEVREDDGEALAELRKKYPQYAERAPAGPFLRLAPDRALWWRAAGE